MGNRRPILFVLSEPGYFRLYGSTIVELGRRGWDVRLAFDRPERRGGPQVPQGAGENVKSLGALPGRASNAATALRLGLDYLRYLEPAFRHAHYLRRRAERNLPRNLVALTWVKSLPRWAVTAALGLARLAERAIPVDRTMRNFINEVQPAVIVVSPVVIIGDSGPLQTELVKVGRSLGIPVVVGTASWDHLTSKGLIRVVPDAVTVWNQAQKDEAVTLHRIPASSILITGAQSLDHWFAPATGDEALRLRRRLGIDAGQRVVLIVGSSKNMAPGDSEVDFVRRWLAAIRSSATADLRDAFVVIRPHPSNDVPWQDADLGDPHAVVHPKQYTGMPLTSDEVEVFRECLVACDAVVGINTTAMIEAAIFRKPVFTVQDAAFKHSQQETLHFPYLSLDAGGFVTQAHTLAEHAAQLGALFAGLGPSVAACERFVEQFVRPFGAHISATSLLCDAIECMATPHAVLDKFKTPVPHEAGVGKGVL
jgi:hypothetical protein